MKLRKIAPDHQKNMIVANAQAVANDSFSRKFKSTKLQTPSMANITKGSGLGGSNGQGHQSIGSMLKETLGRDNADILGSDAEDDQVS